MSAGKGRTDAVINGIMIFKEGDCDTGDAVFINVFWYTPWIWDKMQQYERDHYEN